MNFIIILLIILVVVAYFVGKKFGELRRDRFWKEELPLHRKDAVLRSRAILSGQFSEQLAPYLPDFEFNPTECKFIGKPIDFLVFKGMDNKEVDEIVFVEVKSGDAKLNPIEKKLKAAIEKKKVRWKEYRIPKNLTENDFGEFGA